MFIVVVVFYKLSFIMFIVVVVVVEMNQLNGISSVTALTPNDNSPQPGNEQDEQSMSVYDNNKQ